MMEIGEPIGWKASANCITRLENWLIRVTGKRMNFMGMEFCTTSFLKKLRRFLIAKIFSIFSNIGPNSKVIYSCKYR